ncbi:DUF2501 domain-containing protein [Salinisphaera hydrothermalis]|uniref:DUF2501 domain-containing protein n=1 Tax=Salinisphaera hydrothermalis (strain C41B8) TaxID=1304275 RepID=A0A084IHZ1_SALHC|nr:DUF2501 domain-containing protein [Salinisphaera hydrothermalis]KEZ76325.1 hypothetical protein C41B8_15650 [Salinisphaera hydrothermalis C41B8]
MTRRYLGIALLAVAPILPGLASANAFDHLKQSASSLMNSSGMTQNQNAVGSATLLRELGSGSFNLASPQNVAGVLGYCEKHGYAQSATQQVKNSLLSKIGGRTSAEKSAGFQQGLSGVLESGQGNRFNLTGLEDRIGSRVCGAIAHRALSSFLGQ